VRKRPILISESDARRLRAFLRGRDDVASRDRNDLHELKAELDRAAVVGTSEIPPGVITLYSHAWVRDLASGERREYVLVFPTDADPVAGRISVLAPLGTALLGYREGDEVEWRMPGGLRRLCIEAVIQPNSTHLGGGEHAAPGAAAAHA
jgi:regulator of nucleoside diphosphate kinase